MRPSPMTCPTTRTDEIAAQYYYQWHHDEPTRDNTDSERQTLQEAIQSGTMMNPHTKCF
jgi:hypothetical protein